MKRIISVVLCISLVTMLSVMTFAAGGISIGGPNTITTGSNADFTVNISGCDMATSASVSVSFDSGFTLVSGTWLKSGLNNFSGNKGVIGFTSATDINGAVFKLTLKANSPSATAQNVKITIAAKNGANEILNQTQSKAVTITCAAHNYGSWNNANANQHSRTCQACGYTETVNHTWNGGTVTKTATCKEQGSKQFTCTSCGATRTDVIPTDTAHKLSAYKVIKEATCTEAGLEEATCSECNKKVTRNIAALGHKFSTLKEEKAATCTEGGLKTRTCSRCDTTEEVKTSPLGHDFENPTIKVEATIYSNGLMEGKCKRCGESTTQVIPCTAKDEQTGITVETQEGVFAKGTEIIFSEITEESEQYKSANELLAGVAKSFKLYSVTASLNGAEITPNGKIKVTFALPEGFSKDIQIYYISQEDAVNCNAVMNDDGKSYYIETEKLGTFSICQSGKIKTENEETSANVNHKDVSKTSTIIFWVVIVSVLVLAVGGVTAIVIIAKKKKK